MYATISVPIMILSFGQVTKYSIQEISMTICIPISIVTARSLISDISNIFYVTSVSVQKTIDHIFFWTTLYQILEIMKLETEKRKDIWFCMCYG